MMVVHLPDALAAALGYAGQVGVLAPDMNLWPPAAHELLAAYGPAGRRAMILTHLTFDLVFPAAYAILLFNVLIRLRRRAGVSGRPLLVALPLAAALADYLENAGFIVLAITYPNELPIVTWVTGFFTAAKFALLAVTAGVALAWTSGVIGLRYHRVRGPGVVISGLLAVFLATAVVFGSDPSPRASSLPSPLCSDVLMVALRGNGDLTSQDNGMGGDARVVVDGLSRRFAGVLDTTAVGFPYVTGPPAQVMAHVRSAARLLQAYLDDRTRRCPTEHLVLVGQSEGAAALHLALPLIGHQLVASVLLADPARVSRTSYDDLRSPNDGLLARLLLAGLNDIGRPVPDPVPASLLQAVRSYCLSTDPVCDPTVSTELQGMRSGIHTTYRDNPDGIVDRAVAFAASLVYARVTP